MADWYNSGMKMYTLIAGVNGAGKSSFSGALEEELEDFGVIIDVDKITAELGGSAIAGGKAAVRMIDDCLAQGINFSQETTLSGRKTEKTIRVARDRGYYIRLYYIGLDGLDEHTARIANRVEKGKHGIDEEIVHRRYRERFASLERILPLCDRAVFYDNYNNFVKVAEYSNGKLEFFNGHRPAWLLELESHLDER